MGECERTEGREGRAGASETGSAARGPATDAQLFSALEACLPRRGAVRFLDRHHMGTPFDPGELAEVRRFCSCWSAGGHEFRDWRLERLRKRLLRLSEAYLAAIEQLTEVGPDGLRTVPPVWQQEDATRFDAAAYKLNKLADRVVRCYARLLRTARARLALADGE